MSEYENEKPNENNVKSRLEGIDLSKLSCQELSDLYREMVKL
jgi:hypothetical protein